LTSLIYTARRGHKIIVKLLINIKAKTELNILILSETSVGKSTFINAFINYLNFETLNSALGDEIFY